MTDEVIDFQEKARERAQGTAEAAGAAQLEDGFKPMAKQVKKGKKVTQQAAFNAMVQMKGLVDAQGGGMQKMSQMLLMMEQTVQRVDMHLGVLMHVLMDKELFTDEDWKNAWMKYVVEPERERVKEIATSMKEDEEASDEDAYFGDVILRVLEHKFEDTEIEGQPVEGGALQDFFLNRLLNPQFRRLVLDDVRKQLPDIPELTPETTEKAEVEAKEHPDCHYCGKADCLYCNPLPTDDTPDPEEDTEPDPPQEAAA